MNKNSSTELMCNTSTRDASGQQLIFRLVRPAVFVGCLYVFFIGLDMLLHSHSVLYYVHIGARFALHDPHGLPGYDGQFYYQIARDPLHAVPFLDHPAYRYQRIFYPLLVAALSMGQTNLIPYMLLLVNFIAIVLGTELVARFLIQQNLSPWFSLAFGLYFGQATAFIFDTNEPFTYLFVCLGLLLMHRKRSTLGALCMGLAVLSRETAILFPLGYLILYFYQKRWQDALRLFLLAIVPTIAWYIFVGVLFKATGLSTAPAFQLIPFQGLFFFFYDQERFWSLVILMLIPTLLSWFFLAKVALQHCWKNVFWLIWLFNLALVSCMSPLSYIELVSAGRLSTGLVLAMVFYGCSTRNKTILWACQIYALTFPYYVVSVLASQMN